MGQRLFEGEAAGQGEGEAAHEAVAGADAADKFDLGGIRKPALIVCPHHRAFGAAGYDQGLGFALIHPQDERPMFQAALCKPCQRGAGGVDEETACFAGKRFAQSGIEIL